MSQSKQQAPEITDHLAIALRAFATPTAPTANPPLIWKQGKRTSSKLSASPWVVIFDTETTADSSQALRFGTYQVRCSGEMHETGIFYDPERLADAELATIRDNAVRQNQRLLTRTEFIYFIIFKIGYKLRATFVGFNLPFDFSRIAIHHSTAHSERMSGGFSFKLSEKKYWPHLQVKHVSQKCAFMRFTVPSGQLDNRSDRRRRRKNPIRRGHFIDLKTLAGALFAKPFSLSSLSKFLKVSTPKLEFDEFDGPITDEMVTYAVGDVQTTWECYVELIKRYEQLGIPNTAPERIYSEASIGKAYLKGMGIKSWQNSQPEFSNQIIAIIMSSYFGGRSEVRIRREIREVILCDFLSMYPTVCTLMKLWKFIIAKGMKWKNTTSQTRDWLDCIGPESLKAPGKWLELTTLVRVASKADIFPVRASYGEGDQTTIAANYLSSDFGLWFTLADCVASKLLTGKVPEILEAMTFTPMEPQSGLQPVKISGKADYTVDPINDDFYKKVIELRQGTKTRRDESKGAEKEALDTEQNALKIAANATSYGVFVEINVADKAENVDVTILSGTDQPFNFSTEKVEEIGPFFHPLLASLITGAARLMLTLTETLVGQAGLDWAFCDTDSIAIAKPQDMKTDRFRSCVESIVNWFDNLSPYDLNDQILKIEDVNRDHEDLKNFKSLYCWAVSAKRYALFNIDANTKPIIRKASGHGLGHLHEPYTEKNPANGIPQPIIPVHEIGKGFKLWQHDIWWQIISAALNGHPNQVDLGFHPAFDLPAISRYGATTPQLLRWFKAHNQGRRYGDQVRPFGFLTALTAISFDLGEIIVSGNISRPDKSKALKPIAPFTRDPRQAADSAFDRHTGHAIPPEKLKTFRQILAQYHLQPEAKFLNGNYLDCGTTKRRHVYVRGILHIGKEANKLEEQMALGIDDEANPDYGTSPDQAKASEAELRKIADMLGRKTVANKMGISKSKLAAILKGKLKPKDLPLVLAELRKMAKAYSDAKAANLLELQESVMKSGLRPTAKLLNCDPSNLKRRIKI